MSTLATLWTTSLGIAFAAAAAPLLCAAAVWEARRVAGEAVLGAALGGAAAAVLAMAAAIAPLPRPEAVFSVVANPESVLFRTLASGAACVLFAGLLGCALIRRARHGATTSLAAASAAAGILLLFSASSGFVLPWRAAWRGWWTAAPFAAQSLLLLALILQALPERFSRGAFLQKHTKTNSPCEDPGAEHASAAKSSLTRFAAAAGLAALAAPFLWLALTSPEVRDGVLSGDLALRFWCAWGISAVGSSAAAGAAFAGMLKTPGGRAAHGAALCMLAFGPVLWALLLHAAAGTA